MRADRFINLDINFICLALFIIIIIILLFNIHYYLYHYHTVLCLDHLVITSPGPLAHTSLFEHPGATTRPKVQEEEGLS